MNAKKEFLDTTRNYKVIAASINMDYSDDDDDNVEYKKILYKNYDQNQYDEFLKSIDREYDSGYGSQKLFGTIWCEDGVWFERSESEWWSYYKYPDDIPTSIQNERDVKLNELL